jgi:hypothetical protein
MVHKTTIIPGLTNFIDTNILSHYPPTSLKRIGAAGAIAIYLKRNQNIVDNIINNPLFEGLGVSTADGMIDLEILRDIYKNEITKAGFMRIHFPIIGDVDFTPDDVDVLYKCITSIASSPTQTSISPQFGAPNASM